MTIKSNRNRIIILYSCNLLILPLYFIGWWGLGLALNLFYTIFTGINQFLFLRYLKKLKAKDDALKARAKTNNNETFEIDNIAYNELLKYNVVSLKNDMMPLFKEDIKFE